MPDDDQKDSFAALFEQSSGSSANKRRKLRVGERLEGKVILVGKDAVFIEVDGKREAFIEAVELRAPDGTLSVKVGDTLAAQVVAIDEAAGQIRLGRTLSATGDVSSLERAREAGVAIEGKVTGMNKGGLEVDVAGHRAFCPTSQVDRKGAGDPAELVGRTLSFLVTEIREGGRNIVLSRRAVLEREALEAAKKTIGTLAAGAVMKGTISSVKDFGAFVDLGGIEGLIPASEIGQGRPRALREAFKVGDPVEVMIREIKDPAKPGGPPKITLSLKGAKDAAERAHFEESKEKSGSPRGFGTLGDLLKNRK